VRSGVADESLQRIWIGIDSEEKRETGEGYNSVNKVACPLIRFPSFTHLLENARASLRLT